MLLLFNAHRFLVHIDQVVLRGDNDHQREDELRECRINYLLNNTDETKFKNSIQKIEKKYDKMKLFKNVYTLIQAVLIENLGLIAEMHWGTEQERRKCLKSLNKISNDLEKFRLHVNRSFQRVGSVYNCVYPGISSQWFEIKNAEKDLV